MTAALAAAARRRRAGIALALLLAASLPLLACGKKAEPGPPPGETVTFPRVYPNPHE